MTAAPPAELIECSACHKQAKTKLTPKGIARTPAAWKKQGESVYCAECWRERYYLRAVTMTVAEPLDARWEELRTALKTMWRETTRASNWMMTQFYARDVRRDDKMEKLPPMPKLYLYPETRKLFPALPSQTAAALEQAYKAKYRAIRRDVLWTFAAALPSFKYPVPFPVHNQSWSAEKDATGQRPAVSVRIGERRFLLRLRGGAQFRRQLKAHRLMVSGDAVPGELAIFERGFGSGALRVKMVAWLPRDKGAKAKDAHSTLAVKTAADSLLVAINAEDEKIWTYNGDHLRRWRAEHSKQLQRWSEDAKFENRPVPNFAARRKAAVAKFRNRLDSATHQIAAQLAGYARRRHYAAVSYDDSERSYIDSFPWYELKRKLAEKLDALGLQLIDASGKAEEKTPEPLAEEPSE